MAVCWWRSGVRLGRGAAAAPICVGQRTCSVSRSPREMKPTRFSGRRWCAERFGRCHSLRRSTVGMRIRADLTLIKMIRALVWESSDWDGAPFACTAHSWPLRVRATISIPVSLPQRSGRSFQSQTCSNSPRYRGALSRNHLQSHSKSRPNALPWQSRRISASIYSNDPSDIGAKVTCVCRSFVATERSRHCVWVHPGTKASEM